VSRPRKGIPTPIPNLSLVEVDGVRLVEVDVGTKTIRVAGDANPDDVRAAIVAAGYEVAEIATT
jgi:copper chaperone CopZ